MKKYEDNEEDALFDSGIVQRERDGEIIFLKSSKESHEDDANQVSKKVKVLLLVLVGIVVMSSIFALICFGFVKKSEAPVNVDSSESESELKVWRGAFDERDIYERCCKSVVTVRLGRGSSQTIWSGFIIDENGWIATSLYARDPSARGRLYVTLNDGSEYFVESITENQELGIAFLKISASGLSVIDTKVEETQNGEKIISIGAEDGFYSVVSGEVSSIYEQYIGVSLMLGERGIGAPIFDEQGKILGMACGKDVDKNGRVCFAIPTDTLNYLMESVK